MEALHLMAGGDRGGAMTHVLTLLEELNTRTEALLLCLGDGPLPREARRRGIPCRVQTGSFAAGLRGAEALCRTLSPSLLHCHGSRANLTGALLKGRLSCPVISTVHSDPRLDYLGRPAAALLFGGANAWALRRMDALVCVSRAMGETLCSRGFPAEGLYTMYNGLDPCRPAAETDRMAWRAARGIPEDALLVGTAARMDPVKDLPTLLRGFALAAKREERLYLALAGTGPEERRLRALAAELGITDRLRFPGWVEDMEGFLSALDVFVLSSRWETFPYGLLMAGRAGLPVIAAAAGGVPELMGEGSGLLFPAGDSAALGRALETLAADEQRRAALGEALRRRTADFTPRVMADRMQKIYKEIKTIKGEKQ